MEKNAKVLEQGTTKKKGVIEVRKILGTATEEKHRIK